MKTSKMPPGLRAYWNKKNAKHGGKRKHKRGGKRRRARHHHHHEHEEHMSKRKRKSGGRRRGGGGRRVTRRRSSHRGGGTFGGGIMSDVPTIVAGAAVGFVEKSIKDQTSTGKMLAQLPAPIDQIGRVGNIALLAYVAAHFAPPAIKRHLRTGAKVAATIAAYQMTAKGKAFDKGDQLFISGPEMGSIPYDRAAEQMLGEDEIGELEEEVGRHGHGSFEVDFDDEPHPDDHPAVIDAHAEEHPEG